MPSNWRRALAAGGATAGILGGLFGDSGLGPYNEGMGEAKGAIDKYTKQATDYMQPYMDAGEAVIPGLAGMFDKYSHPEEAYNQFAQHYEMSPGAQSKMNKGMDAVRNAMASRGLGGSGSEDKALTDYTQGVIDQDMQNQWGDIMGAAKMGAGLGSTLYGGGLQGALGAGRFAAQAGEDIAGINEAQAAAAAQAAQNRTGSILGGIGAAIGGFF